MIHEQHENINKEVETIKKNEIKVIKLKNTINELKQLIQRVKNKI